MAKRLVLVCTLAVLGLWACEINVESTYDARSKVDEDSKIDDAVADSEDQMDDDTDGTTDTGPKLDAITPNDRYPCSDDPNIPKERCQGQKAWDKFEPGGEIWNKYANNHDETLRERGKYVANHVAVCIDCHTPLNSDSQGTPIGPKDSCPDWFGARDCDRKFSGWYHAFYQLAPGNKNRGEVGIPNITPHPKGIGEWTPSELRRAFTKGVRPEDDDQADNFQIIFPFMPYYQYHHMKKDDQNAVIAYLHSLEPINTQRPLGPKDRQKMPSGSPFAKMDGLEPIDYNGDGEKEGIKPASEDFMPAVTAKQGTSKYKKAQKGKYLTRLACTQCHTPAAPPKSSWSDEQLLQKYMFFKRGKKGLIGDNGESMPYGAQWPGAPFGKGFPMTIRAQNITSHKQHGVGDYTQDELLRAINGFDLDNEKMCPPMPVDTFFSQITKEDKEAIAVYLQNSEPRANSNPTDSMNCKGQ